MDVLIGPGRGGGPPPSRSPPRSPLRSPMRARLHVAAWLICGLCALPAAAADVAPLPEYQVKAGFLYNFALFTEWPEQVGATLNLCVHGEDPFNGALAALAGKPVGARRLALRRDLRADARPETLRDCQIVYVAPGAAAGPRRIAEVLAGQAVLIVADRPELGDGAALTLALARDRVVFDADLRAAGSARVALSSRLLRLAREVRQ